MALIMFKWGNYLYCSSLVPDFTSFLLFRLIRHRSCCHCSVCHWALDCLFCRSVSEVKKAQLLYPLMKSRHSRRICVWAISSVCKVFFTLAELDEVQDQLRHFCGTFRRISGIVLYPSVFFPEWKRYRWCRPNWSYLGLFLGFPHSVYSLPVLFLLHTISSNCSLRDNEWKMSQSTKIILRIRY